ncbi:kinase-like protein [Lophiostoma macrostomum CBS 122681]|uniref:Kinase-like protein n=1 Tax=Lophiostoma macrostomum CBS 122681 TaxID=1314788 RepID=A0A6A6SKH2_9PLEO|nr:kinase-like protein [Lophiostoma macrostomum CBS 122681]
MCLSPASFRKPMAIVQLRSELGNLRVENADDQAFVPYNLVKGVLNKENVSAALLESKVERQDLESTTVYILRGARRIFAILLHIYEVKSILKFIAYDELQPKSLDQSLPFRQDVLHFLPTETAGRFCEAQWQFSAPTFSRNFAHRELSKRTVMPITRSIHIGKGSVGQVYEIELHPGHHKLHQLEKGGSVRIARKQISIPPKNRSIQDEGRVLSILNSLKHPNILELIGSYSFKNDLNLLFPLASQTLEACFSENDRMLGFEDRASVLCALPGLASALHALHQFAWEDVKYIGCHHDIKPDNIFRHEGRLILADFGLATMKDPSQGSETRFQEGQGYYFAPECEDYEHDFQRYPIYRSSDIWSLGCVLLEILVFMDSGDAGIQNFRQERTVKFGRHFKSKPFHHGSHPSPVVMQYQENLSKVGNDSTSTLVTLIRDMLSIESGKRPIALHVQRELSCVAVKHTSHEIDTLFQKATSLDPPFDIILERERFRGWKDEIGTPLPMQGAHFSSNEVCEPISSSTIASLLEMKKTLVSMEDPVHNDYLTVANLRETNNILTNAMEAPTQKAILTKVELRLLDQARRKTHQFKSDLYGQTPTFQRVGLLAALENMYNLCQNPMGGLSKKWQLDRARLYNLDEGRSETFHLGRYAYESMHHDVLIQWIYYNARWANKTTGTVLFERIDSIVEFLHKISSVDSFHILDCLGFYHDTTRHAFGVLFIRPKVHTNRTMVPTTLFDLIRNTKDVRKRPDLGQLFALAHALAQSLLECHSIRWLHKNISAHHVVFFSKTDGSSTCDVSIPYVIGFDHSRKDQPNEYTEGPWDVEQREKYQHPVYRKGEHRFCPTFDYFSLGLVLLEIGLWKDLDAIFGPRPMPDDYHEYISRIRREHLPLLGPRMGKIYREAT